VRVESFPEPFTIPRGDNLAILEDGLKNAKSSHQEIVPSIGEQQFNDMIERSNKALRGLDTHLKLSVHQKTHQIVVKVMNTETNEIVKEIPPEKLIDLMYNLCEQLGLFVDEKA